MTKEQMTKLAAVLQINSVLGKRAFEEINVHRAGQQKAAAARDATLDALLSAGCVEAHQKSAAAAMLGSHADTLGLLMGAAKKIEELSSQLSKRASELGRVSTAPSEKQASYDSVNDPYVGRRTSQLKQSDIAILRVLEPAPTF